MYKKTDKKITLIGQFISYDDTTGMAKLMFLEFYDNNILDHSVNKKQQFTSSYLLRVDNNLKRKIYSDISKWTSPLSEKYFNVKCFTKRKNTKCFAEVYDINMKRIPIEDAMNHTVECCIKYDSYVYKSTDNNLDNITAGWCIKLKKMRITAL
jgi:hypothetical protein